MIRPRDVELEQVNSVFVAFLGDFFEPDFWFEPDFRFGPTSGLEPLPVWGTLIISFTLHDHCELGWEFTIGTNIPFEICNSLPNWVAHFSF